MLRRKPGLLSWGSRTQTGSDKLQALETALIDVLDRAGVATDPLTRMAYSQSLTAHEHGYSPFAVIRPTSTQTMSAVIRICTEFGACWTIRGGGNAMQLPAQLFRTWDARDGFGSNLTQPLVVITTEAMSQIAPPDLLSRSVTVGAGVTFDQLATHLSRLGAGFAFAVDTPETMTIGGALASQRTAGAASPGTGFDGTVGAGASINHHVLSIRGVLSDGRIATARADVAESGPINLVALLLASAEQDFVVCEAELQIGWARATQNAEWFASAELGPAVEVVEDASAALEIGQVAVVTLVSPNAVRLLGSDAGLPRPGQDGAWLLRLVGLSREGSPNNPSTSKVRMAPARFGEALTALNELAGHADAPVPLDSIFAKRCVSKALSGRAGRIQPIDAWVPVDQLTRLWRDVQVIEEDFGCAIAALISPLSGQLRLAVLSPPGESIQTSRLQANAAANSGAAEIELRAAIEARDGYVTPDVAVVTRDPARAEMASEGAQRHE